MANTYKNIVITPNRDTDAANVPFIRFSGGDTASNTDINVRVYTTQSGTLSFEGSAGQLFSITNDLTNTIFSVNDVSGIPSLEINANGTITMGVYGGNVGIGTANPTAKLQANGTFFVTQNNTSSLDVVGEIAEFAHNANTYAQIHVRNANTGTRSSSDIVATADNGTDATDFIDLGINGSTYNDPAFTIGVAKDGYLYTSNGNLTIGTANTSKYISLFTGGTLAANERLRIDTLGRVGINTTAPTANLDVFGSVNAAIYLINNTFANATPVTVNAASSNAVYTTPGTQRFHPSAAKFWIKADAAGAIQGSHGVSSIVDVGVGMINVVFSTAFTTTNYSVVSTILATGAVSNTTARVAFANSSALPLTTGCQLNCDNFNGVRADPANWLIVGYGNIV